MLFGLLSHELLMYLFSILKQKLWSFFEVAVSFFFEIRLSKYISICQIRFFDYLEFSHYFVILVYLEMYSDWIFIVRIHQIPDKYEYICKSGDGFCRSPKTQVSKDFGIIADFLQVSIDLIRPAILWEGSSIPNSEQEYSCIYIFIQLSRYIQMRISCQLPLPPDQEGVEFQITHISTQFKIQE